MTATTALGLPYQTGTDRPCDAPDVWCQFATLESAALKALQDIRDRLVPAVPVAVGVTGISTLTPTGAAATTVQSPITAVMVDTDDMYDADTSTYRLTMQRTGVYYVKALSKIVGGSNVGGSMFQVYAANSSFGPTPPLAGGATSFNASAWMSDLFMTPDASWAALARYPRTSNLANITTAPSFPSNSVGAGLYAQTASATLLTVGGGLVMAYWMRDAV